MTDLPNQALTAAAGTAKQGDALRPADGPEPWRCPVCRGRLVDGAGMLACRACDRAFPVLDGIPDLRLDHASWLDLEEDRTLADRLARMRPTEPVECLVREVFASRPDWDRDRIERRVRAVLDAPRRFSREVDGWLAPFLRRPGDVLDVGCGNGTWLAAAAAHGVPALGIDVSLSWLVVARAMIEHFGGGRARLAAAHAERLPLADGALGGVVSLDVLEHVAEPVAYLREIDRVTARDGWCALATPNRFSLTAEPHVGVWGVGWLPRRAQKDYVRWRSGLEYEHTRLLGTREACRLIERSTRFRPRLLVPEVPEEEIAAMPRPRGRLARLYNRVHDWPACRPLLLAVGPFFRIVGEKQAGA